MLGIHSGSPLTKKYLDNLFNENLDLLTDFSQLISQICVERLHIGGGSNALQRSFGLASDLLHPRLPIGHGHPWAQVVLRLWCLPAHGKQGLELQAEAFIQPAVDERIVAGAAHGEAVQSEIKAVLGLDPQAGNEQHVTMKREPTDGKDHHHQNQHLDALLLAFVVGDVLWCGDVPNGVA